MDLYLKIKLIYMYYFLNTFFVFVINETLAICFKNGKQIGNTVAMYTVNKSNTTLQLLDLIKKNHNQLHIPNLCLNLGFISGY